MFDTLQVHVWYHTMSPFVCRRCGHSTSYAVEPSPLAEMRDADEHAVDERAPVRLRCHQCDGITLFPRARLDHQSEIGFAVVLARAMGLEVLRCDTCLGWGVAERPARLASQEASVEDPCPACLGAGFVWSEFAYGRAQTFEDILASRLTRRSG